MAHSYEIRKAVMAAIDAGMLGKDVEKIFGVSISSQQLWKRRLDETGDFVRKPPGLGPSPQIKTDDFIKYMSCPINQSKTQSEIGAEFGVLKMTISNMMRKIGFTRKKKTSPTANPMPRSRPSSKKKSP